MIKKLIIIIISSIFASTVVSCKPVTISFGDDTSKEISSSQSSSSLEDTTSSMDNDNSSSSSSSSNSSISTTSSSENSNTTNSTTPQSSSENNDNNATNTNKEPEKTEVTVNITDNSEYYVQNPIIPQKVYYSNSFIFPQSSSSYLTKYQVSLLNNYELGIARNEIYARHGYTFDLAQFRNYFNSQSWYTPISKNVTLSKVEQYNVDLIKAEEDRRGVTW